MIRLMITMFMMLQKLTRLLINEKVMMMMIRQ